MIWTIYDYFQRLKHAWAITRCGFKCKNIMFYIVVNISLALKLLVNFYRLNMQRLIKTATST